MSRYEWRVYIETADEQSDEWQDAVLNMLYETAGSTLVTRYGVERSDDPS